MKRTTVTTALAAAFLAAAAPAQTTITGLGAAADGVATDVLLGVDVSDTTGSVNGTTKKFPLSVLSSFYLTAIDTFAELDAVVADQSLLHTGLIDTFAELDAIVADQSLFQSSLIDTFAELDAIVADQSLLHTGLIDTFAELDAIVADQNLPNESSQARQHPEYDVTPPPSFGAPEVGFPHSAGWTDDDIVRNSGAVPTWVTATSYTEADLVLHSGAIYRVDNDHTSTTDPTVDTANYTLCTHVCFPRTAFIPDRNRFIITFRAAEGHGFYGATLALIYTDDWGQNWSYVQISDETDTDLRAADVLYLDNDRLICIYTAVTAVSAPASRTSDIFARFSDDFGETWGAATLIADGGANPASIGDTGGITQLRDGTILKNVYTSSNFAAPYATFVSKVIRSTDNGETWSSPITVADLTGSSLGANEADYFQPRGSDTVVALIRASNGGSPWYLYRNTSTDGGATWGTPADVTPSNYNRAKPVIFHTADGMLWLATRTYAGGAGVYYSTDDGLTYTGPETGFTGTGGDQRTDILPELFLAEGGISQVGENAFAVAFGNETTIGGANGDVYLRTWLRGPGGIGPSGTKGLVLKGGGGISWDTLAPPILTTTERNALTPAEGDIIWNSTDSVLQYYDGTAWETSADADEHVAITGDTMTGDLVVPAEAYGVGWNGSNEVPTKNDVYDKVETISAGSGAFADSTPVLLNTTTKDVVVGAAQINTAKLSIDGDDNQTQFAIQGHSTQTTNLIELENSGGTLVASVPVSGIINTAVGIDAIGAVDLDYGSADVTDHTFTTDGTGTAEIVLPAGAIDSTEILDGTIAAADLATGAVTSTKIFDGTIAAVDIASNAVTTAKINADAVTNAKVADDALDSEHYAANSIDAEHLSGNARAIYEEKHAASHTLSIDATTGEGYGSVHYVTAASVTLTLPAATDGCAFTIICNTANTVIVDANAADLIILDGTSLDDGDSIDSTAAAGDIVTLTYYDATGWYAASNGWTDGGPS